MATRSAKTKEAASAGSLKDRDLAMIAIEDLDLDPQNPRFGDKGGKATQKQLVERIVTQFGISDLLASLSLNGYFASEPLVAVKNGKRFTIAEGNRRLAACMILAADNRAQAFQDLRPESPSDVWSEGPALEIPVLVFDPDEKRQLLPYLGVRHIVGSQPWDSYAKAHWISEVTKNGDMTLDEVASAIGDSNRTVFRMLDGYHFINQLIEEGRFRPNESHRKGRGSNPDYPFSWVYSLLDNSTIREYLHLPQRAQTKEKPIDKKNIGAAAKVVAYMFGTKGQSPSITDSRHLGDLADAVSDPQKRAMLERGLSVSEIERASRSAPEQLAEALQSAEESLNTAVALLSGKTLKPKEAVKFLPLGQRVRNVAVDVNKRLADAAAPSDDD